MYYVWKSVLNNWLAGLITLFSIIYLIENLMLPRNVKDSMLLVGPVISVIFIVYTYLIVSEIKRIKSVDAAIEGTFSSTDGEKELSNNESENETNSSDGLSTFKKEFRKIKFVLLLGVYLLMIKIIGFEIATLIYLPSALFFLGIRNFYFIALYTVIYSLVVVVIFYYLFHVRLPMLFL